MATEQAAEPRHFPKLIYLERRHPGLTPDAFTRRWRQHGALAMTMPRWVHVRRYAQCDITSPREPIPGISSDADGAGIIWYRNEEARRKVVADTSSRQTMESDQDETFAERVADCAVVTTEAVLRAGPRTAFKLMSFVKTAPGVDKARLPSFIEESYAPALLRETPGAAGEIVRYAVNYRGGADPLVTKGLDCDLVEEIWFASADERMASVPAFAAFAAAHGGGVLGTRRNYFTNDNILYDKP